MKPEEREEIRRAMEMSTWMMRELELCRIVEERVKKAELSGMRAAAEILLKVPSKFHTNNQFKQETSAAILSVADKLEQESKP